ncbi:MAG: glutamate-ammonia-ligase adenylyltransferase [Candidatus Tokpelaia sp. JSC189]|nr:MAG: glutamate-ammonia-ligase adenylyltransferase [Candidatus Tokpelaia sp. JSC189]
MASNFTVPRSFLAADLSDLTSCDRQKDAWLGELHIRAENIGLNELAAFLRSGCVQVQFISAVMALSPFLRETFINNPQFLDPLRMMALVDRLGILLQIITQIDLQVDMTENFLMQKLRLLKREVHGLIALGELSHVLTVAESAVWLSRLAEKTLGTALRFLLREAGKAGKIALQDDAHPEKDCGLIVLGMGKFGAYELNYSSDIDLILFVDETSAAIDEPYEGVEIFSRLARRLVRIMQERTSDGYVFRVDLRLRPDPSSTPLALSVRAALRYYEGRGQNWERAAMIKARPVAGDIAAGERFLRELFPYIWRKYLDYAAIADIHSIKRQIHVYQGYGCIAVRGHNIKLWRGGIREIELFVQTQQLIAGGRFAQLRGRRTVDTLSALCKLGWITTNVCDSLCGAYTFLCNVEHCIQMVADEQTHILPKDGEGFLRIACLMGYQAEESFARDVLQILKTVQSHYDVLFEYKCGTGIDNGNLIFTSEDADPETLAILSRLGFRRLGDIYRIIRGWHFGYYRATQSAEARERLTELTPALLQAFGATWCADEALVRFDAFLQELPTDIQFFNLLHSNLVLLDMLMMIMSAAPRLAEIITRKPHVFDGMLNPEIVSEFPTYSYLEERLASFLDQVNTYEEILDCLRIFADEQRFLIGIRLLTGVIDGERAGQAFTDLADLMIATCLHVVEEQFSRLHGRVKGGRICILGMGKLGSRELTAGSDIDLILLYDHDPQTEMSDGKKPLYVSQYYMWLTQRLLSALSAPIGGGVFYEVDLRLRPSGNKGPLAVPFSAFSKYQRNEAWLWEHMALTRARAIAGDRLFREQLEGEVARIIALPRDAVHVAAEVCGMRRLIEKEKPARTLWDLKMAPGGIIDLEFIAQYAVLIGRVGFEAGRTTSDTLLQLPKNFATIMDGSDLHHACVLFTDISQIMQLCLNKVFNLDDMPPSLSTLLQRVVGEPDMLRVKNLIRETASGVRNAFEHMIGIL